jgi:hypothetical protein
VLAYNPYLKIMLIKYPNRYPDYNILAPRQRPACSTTSSTAFTTDLAAGRETLSRFGHAPLLHLVLHRIHLLQPALGGLVQSIRFVLVVRLFRNVTRRRDPPATGLSNIPRR